MGFSFLVTLLLSGAGGSFSDGITGKWVPTAAGSYDASTRANWMDESGEALMRIPTNSADTMQFDAVTPEDAQTPTAENVRGDNRCPSLRRKP